MPKEAMSIAMAMTWTVAGDIDNTLYIHLMPCRRYFSTLPHIMMYIHV